ncbi:MAG: BamA/TamA family outer membrane protein [Candidatus Eremiobacteraeota bacterium]|nr:BamA/TamA family outer membrane protein [Candidatus Eremiobacteraeota bacterium]
MSSYRQVNQPSTHPTQALSPAWLILRLMKSDGRFGLIGRFLTVAIALGIAVLIASPTQTPAAAVPIITAVNVRGNNHVPAARVLAVVRSTVGAPLDTKQVAADQNAILGLGFFTDVRSDVRATPGGVALNFIVLENPSVARIVFTGNQHVKSDILTALMDTTVGAVLNTNTLRDDVQKINSYYDKLGFTGTRHVQNIRVQRNGELDLQIKEGVVVSQVKVTGNTVVPTGAILGAMKTKPGTTFSEGQFQDDLQAIQSLYKDLGFSGSFDGAPEPNNPGVVDVNVCESRVGAIEIAGNSVTKDYVIRRLLRMYPGALITDARLRRDYEAINNTQFFKSVDLSTKPFGDKCGYVTLVWTVVEQRTGTASVGVSYGGGGQYGQGLAGNVSFSQNNINGTGNGASVSLQRGQHISNVNFGISVPYIHKFRADSLSFSFFNNDVNNQPYPVYKEPGNNPFFSVTPLNGGTITNTLSNVPTSAVGGPCSPGPTPCTGQFADYSSRQAGVQIGFGHPTADYTRLNFGLSATRLFQSFSANGFPQQFLDVGSGIIGSTQTTSPLGGTTGVGGGAVRPGTSNLRSLNASLVRDNRDDVQNPRFGGTSSLAQELSSKAFGSDFSFVKGDFDYTKFRPVRKHSTLAFHFNYGYSSGGTALPYNDLFSLSDQQLRGTKYVFYGDRELLGQLELRIPVTTDKKFSVALFADTGDTPYVTPNIGPSPAPTPPPPAGPHAPASSGPLSSVTYSEAPYHLKSDVGFGIRVYTPILPQPIRIDFATGQNGAHVSFGINQSF